MSGPLRFWTFLLVFVLTGASLKAADGVLDSLVAVALQNNPELKSALAGEQAAVYDSKAAGALPDPMFSVAAMNMPRGSFILNEAMMSGVGLKFQQEIPWPGKLRARSQMAELDRQRQHENARAVGNRLIRAVSEAYYEYSFWRLNRQLIDQNIALAQATASAAETRYANGGGTVHDALQAQTAKARLDVKRLQCDEQIAAAGYRLLQLLGDTTSLGQLEPSLPPPAVPDGAGALDLSHNPMLTASGVEVQKAEAGVKLSRSEYWPGLSFGVQYLIRDRIPMDASLGKDWWSLEVGFKVPLWFFAKQKHHTAASRARLEAARDGQFDTRLAVRREASDAQRMISTLRGSLSVYDSTIIPQARATFEAAQVAYEVGKVDFNAVLDAQMALYDIETERLDLLKRLNQKAAELQEIIGNSYQVNS